MWRYGTEPKTSRPVITGSFVGAALTTKHPTDVPVRAYGAYSIEELFALNGLKDRAHVRWYSWLLP